MRASPSVVNRALAAAALLSSTAFAAPAQSRVANGAGASAPLVIGETFTIASRVLGEVRRINVYAPPGYAASPDARLPVLYMPDGGMGEDFLHVAGLVQVSVGNGTMRPFLLVGIENTERRRDMTGPTTVEADRRIAPRVGGSQAFRTFIRTELMPEVTARYRTTDETAIVGESLAGLFVVETFLLEPDLFDGYVAIDPSLWWNGERLVREAGDRLRARPATGTTLYLASSAEQGIAEPTRRLAAVLERGAVPGLTWHHAPMPEEQHATIYHPAALRAFRTLFRPDTAATAATRDTVASDVAGAIAVHRAWWQALVLADTAYLRARSAPAVTFTMSSGRTLDLPAMLAQAASQRKGAEVAVTWAEEAVRAAAPAVAVVTSRVTETVGSSASVYRYLAVLARGADGWRVSAAQSTRELASTPRVSAAAAGPLADFAGSYRTPRGLALRVVVRDSALVLIEPSGAEIPFAPVAPALFEMTVPSPSSEPARIAFTRDATGRVTSMSRLLSGSVNSFPRMP